MEREENKNLKQRLKEMEAEKESTKHARRIWQRSSECLDEQFNSYIYIYIYTHTHIYIYIVCHTHMYIYCCLNTWWMAWWAI
jgi:cell shape-determining protein MreC